MQGENCYFCVPAPSLDVDNNVVYHQGLFESMINKLGYTAHAINEAHAVIFAELADNDFTGIGLSFGGGMANACIAYKSIPCLSFSVARGGDWIDKTSPTCWAARAARRRIKERGIDIRDPKSREEEAVSIYYRNLISYVLSNIKTRFESGKEHAVVQLPVDIACAGGTSGDRQLHRGLPRRVREDRLPISRSAASSAARKRSPRSRRADLVAAAIGE
ncbi:MAG: hypothetical protein U1E73_08290 [Planctomycetota bacterium]